MSKNKTRPLNLLIIDDDHNYVEALNRDAQGHRIILKHVSSVAFHKYIYIRMHEQSRISSNDAQQESH